MDVMSGAFTDQRKYVKTYDLLGYFQSARHIITVEHNVKGSSDIRPQPSSAKPAEEMICEHLRSQLNRRPWDMGVAFRIQPSYGEDFALDVAQLHPILINVHHHGMPVIAMKNHVYLAYREGRSWPRPK
jgi:hypothetical protein